LLPRLLLSALLPLAALALAPAAPAQVPCEPAPPLIQCSSPGAGARTSLAAPRAQAAFSALGNPMVGLEDEDVIFSNQASAIAAQWRAFGVDITRIQAFWDAVSPDTKSPTMPAGFNPANHNDPQYQWGALDRAVAAARGNGVRVMMTINQAGPRWASLEPGNPTPFWKPNPAIFAQFAGAVAQRYGSAVDLWLILSEPNQLVFLRPQFEGSIPVSPHIARALTLAAYPAVKAADPATPAIIGELAPIGSPPSPTSGVSPMQFIREMACVNKLLRPLRAPRCNGFQPALGDGFGYHPYVNTRKAPSVPMKNLELAKMGDLKRLLATLDTITRRGRMRSTARRFPLYLTEYGYISNPPSAKYGVSLPRQSLFNSQSSYITWQLRSRVKLISQYQWNDDEYFFTGLLFRDFRPKSAFFSFPTPFFIDSSKGRKKSRFWGQVRPDAARRVILQVKPRGRARFRNLRTLRTDFGGYFTTVIPAKRFATYRFRYFPAAGAPALSQNFVVTERRYLIPAPRRRRR
jgi:hypothetical protein